MPADIFDSRRPVDDGRHFATSQKSSAKRAAAHGDTIGTARFGKKMMGISNVGVDDLRHAASASDFIQLDRAYRDGARSFHQRLSL